MIENDAHIKSPVLGSWAVPTTIEIKEECLWYRESGPLGESSPQKFAAIRPDNRQMREMLESFARLVEVDPHTIREFALSWGWLGICEQHALPCGHSVKPIYESSSPSWCPPQTATTEDGRWVIEPLSVWRDYAKVVRATTTLILKVQSERLMDKRRGRAFGKSLAAGHHRVGKIKVEKARNVPGTEEDWRAAISIDPWPTQFSIWSVWGARLAIAEIINCWLEITGVRPTFFWESEPEFELCSRGWIGGGLITRIAVQLMRLASNSQLEDLCVECGNPFSLYRGQWRGRGNRCRNCARKTKANEAAKRYRRRLKKGISLRPRLKPRQVERVKHLLITGAHVRDIARRTGATVANVYKYHKNLGPQRRKKRKLAQKSIKRKGGK